MKQFSIAENKKWGLATTLATHTFTLTSTNVLTSEWGIAFIPPPTITVKYNISSDDRQYISESFTLECYVGGTQVSNTANYYSGSARNEPYQRLNANVSATLKCDTTNSYYVSATIIESVFNSSNPTVVSVPISWKLVDPYGFYFDPLGTDAYLEHYYAVGTRTYGSGLATVTDGTITLNAPPTFSETLSYTGDFSGVPYAGLTTANVTLSSLSAKYGGNLTSAEFTIGSQTVSKANPVDNDVLSIPLGVVGTFTPTVKVTDSRGQVTTHPLSDITVQGYVAPSVVFSVERTTSTGVPNDEGEYAVIRPTFTFTDAIAELQAPAVAVTDDSGYPQQVSTTWYSSRASDGTLSGSVDWSSLSTGATVYGLVSITGDFNTQKSYQIAVTPTDSVGTGTTITQTLGGAFYTIDFLAGGHGISFGEPISESELFESVGGASAPTFATDTYYETVTSGGITNYELLVNEPSDWSTDWTDYYVKVHDGLFKCNMDMFLKGVRVPNIFISTSDPTSVDGEDGDVWIKYTSSV